MGPAICRSLKFLIDQAAFDEHLATFVSCRLESLGSSDVGHHLSWNNVVAAFRRRKLAVIGMGGSSSRVIPPRQRQCPFRRLWHSGALSVAALVFALGLVAGQLSAVPDTFYARPRCTK